MEKKNSKKNEMKTMHNEGILVNMFLSSILYLL